MTAQDIIEQLTLPEKVALLQGETVWTTRSIPRLGLKRMWLADGPHGLRKSKRANRLSVGGAKKATCFPTASAMACAWDTALAEELGAALGREAAAQGVHMVLGPGLNHKRNPLCGRNFEYFSEDPYLSGKLAAGYIRGIQSQGVAACPKHFAANSQELRRMNVDSVMDERTLREIYLTAFEIAVKEGKPKGIMASYNPVNGVYAAQNSHLLQDILRKEWGFSGAVVSDWGACHDPVASLQAGLNLNMPAPGADNALAVQRAVAQGELSEETLDARLRELLPVILATTERPKEEFSRDAHHALAQKCALNSMVLLENDGILPLKAGTQVALIGELAKKPRYQGAGSSQVRPTRLENLVDALGHKLPVTYARGYRKGYANPNAGLIAQAVNAAKRAEIALVCIGLEENAECEAFERQDLELPRSQLRLLEAVCAVNKNVVVLLFGGAPFRVPRHSSIHGVLLGYLGGQAGASAMAKLLLGIENPCGHLAESWVESLSDTPCADSYPAKSLTAQYREGLFTGYRYYDTAAVAVRYPFGHGLSYTTFAYSDLQATRKQVRFTVTNTGDRPGVAVPQIYIACRTGKVFRPRKELKGFCRVALNPGESKEVTIPLEDYAFRYYNVITGKWELETAHYQVILGESSADEKLKVTLRLLGSDAPNPCKPLPHYESGQIKEVSKEEFYSLLGHPVQKKPRSEAMTAEDTLSRLCDAKTPAARWLGEFLRHKVENPGKKPDMTYAAIYNLPVCRLSQMSRGHFTRAMVEDFLFWADGHFFRGIKRMVQHYIQGRKEALDWEESLDP